MSRVVEEQTTFDGIKYPPGSTLPDIGHWDDRGTGYDRAYYGLSTEFNKLPTVAKYPEYKDKILSGSTAVACDTFDTKMYLATMDKWYPE